MANYEVNNFEEYWIKYDSLVKNLKKEHQFELANKLVDAKKNVNGLTDGWFEFKNEFEVVIKQNKSILNIVNLELALFLIKTIKSSLER
jgi:hypothetical protein